LINNPITSLYREKNTVLRASMRFRHF
jgi:hypothetical protein